MKKILSALLILSIIFTNFTANAQKIGYDFPHKNLLSQAMYVKESNSNSVVFYENAQEKLSISYLTMIMTSIVAIESFPDIDSTYIEYTLEMRDVYRNTLAPDIKLVVGDKLSIHDHLYMMMLPSNVRSATAIAFYYDSLQSYDSSLGEKDENNVDIRATYDVDSPFVKKMNETAIRIGCKNTYFTNPSGLYHAENYSTAEDVAIMIEYAMNLPYFSDIFASSSYISSATSSKENGYKIFHTNPLFSKVDYDGRYYNEYVIGGKTGRNSVAGTSIACVSSDGDYEYITVALNAPTKDDFGNLLDSHGSASDTTRLVYWCFSSISKHAVYEKGALISDVKLKYAWGKNSVQLVASENVVALLPDDILSSHLSIDVNIPDEIEAPVKRDDIIAQANIYYDDTFIGKVDLVAKESIGKSYLLFLLDIILQPQFILTTLVVIIILIVVLLKTSKKRKANSRIKRRKKKSLQKGTNIKGRNTR